MHNCTPIAIEVNLPRTLTEDSQNEIIPSGHSHEVEKASTSRAGIVKLNDTLVSLSKVEALTANQGRELAERIEEVLSASEVGAINKTLDAALAILATRYTSAYATYQAARDNVARHPENALIYVVNDPQMSFNGLWTVVGGNLVKAPWDVLSSALTSEPFEVLQAIFQGAAGEKIEYEGKTYDTLATFMQTLEEGKQYIQDVLIDLARSNNFTASYLLTESGKFQEEVNSDVQAAIKHIALPYDEGKIYGLNERVKLASGDIVKSTVAGNVTDPNVDMTGWVTPNLIIYPEVFGAIAGEADSSDALNAAILFCSSNNYVLDGRGKAYNANSLVLKDNTHIKRISINSNLYNTMNSVITTDYGTLTPLKNITLDTVYINGKRELHTNVTSQMDGGRCAVLIRRPIDGLTIRNCKLNNAVTDGLMLFPVDWAITAGDWTHFVKNVTIENSEMFWNGRWGISADSVKHMTLRNVKAKFNGLDVGGGGAYTTGKSARLFNGKQYGGGFDLEEYHGFSYSKDVNIINCDMTENAGTGLVFDRTGYLVGTTEITITGGNYDSGTSADSNGQSIGVSTYSDTGTITAYKITISQPNLNGGDLYLRKCQDADVSQLLNLNAIRIDQSAVVADKIYNYVYVESSNSNFLSGIRDGSDDFLGTNNAESVVWLHTENKVSAYSNLKIRAGGINIGGIRFQKAQNPSWTGVTFEFMNGEDPVLGITQYGSILPAVTSTVTLGLQNKRFKRAWLDNANMIGLGVFGDNSAAISGGLVAGDFYRTSTGQVMVVY